MNKRERKEHNKYDRLWKEAIEELFEEFLVFFAPELAEQVDFSKKYDFLEQELHSIQKDSESKDRRTDKLVKLYLKDNTEKWVLCHVEVQGYKENEFAKRMFQYFYRILDKYDRETFVLAIFSDGNKGYSPSQYQYAFHDTNVTFNYRTYKIMEQDEGKLLKSENPFAYVVLVALYTIQARGKGSSSKYEFKSRLLRILNSKDWERSRIEKLFVFMDNMLQLPAEWENQFQKERKLVENGGMEGMGLNLENSPTGQYIAKEKAKETAIKTAIKMFADKHDKEFILKYVDLTSEEFDKYVLGQSNDQMTKEK